MLLRAPIKRKICPFVQDPLHNCYCLKMGSQDIEKTVYYCSKYFESCDIYKERSFAYKEVSIHK